MWSWKERGITQIAREERVRQREKHEGGIRNSSSGDITQIDLLGQARPWWRVMEEKAGEIRPTKASL